MRDAESRFANSTRPGTRAWRRLPAVAVLLAIASLTGGASSASAAYNHVPGVEFGPNGTAGSTFPCCTRSISYQQASNRLYVGIDSKIYGFDVSTPGTFTPLAGGFPINNTLFPFGEIGVDNSFTASAGNIYSAPDSSTVRGYDSSGAALPSPGWPIFVSGSSCGVSADSEGYVWASTEGSQGAREYNPSGGASIGSFPRNPARQRVVQDRDRLVQRRHLYFGLQRRDTDSGIPLLQGDQLHDLRKNTQQPLQKRSDCGQRCEPPPLRQQRNHP